MRDIEPQPERKLRGKETSETGEKFCTLLKYTKPLTGLAGLLSLNFLRNIVAFRYLYSSGSLSARGRLTVLIKRPHKIIRNLSNAPPFDLVPLQHEYHLAVLEQANLRR